MESNPLSSINPLNMTGIQASIDTLGEVAQRICSCVCNGSIAHTLQDTGTKLKEAIGSYILSGTQMTQWMESLVAEVTARVAIYKDIDKMDPKELSQLIQLTAHKTDNQKLVQGLLDKLKERLDWELKQTSQSSTALEAFKELALVGAARGNLSPQDQSALQTTISNSTQSPNLMQTPIFHNRVIETFGTIQGLTPEQKTIDYDNKIYDFLSGRKETPALSGQLVEVTEGPESPLEIAARIGNTGGLDFLIRMTRPWETSEEIERLKSIAIHNIKDPTKKKNFINTFTILCRFYQNDREFMLKVLRGFPQDLRDDREFMLKVLKGFSQDLRNDREFILGVIKEAPNWYASIITSNVLGKELRNESFIKEMAATFADTVKKNAQRRSKG